MFDFQVQPNKQAVASLDIRYHSFLNSPGNKVDHWELHTDEHYLFFILENGNATMMIDFRELNFDPSTLYYIMPGQVRHRDNYDKLQGWFLSVHSSLIPPECKTVLDDQYALHQPCILNDKQLSQCRRLLNLLIEKYKEDDGNPFYWPVIYSLLNSFLGMAATCFSAQTKQPEITSRPAQIAAEFKKLLRENVKSQKSPAAYAAKLHVSESYLNEVIKRTTGSSVSYWILNEVMLEAKRLLYSSSLNVKEVAHALGYDDHTYFSKLFKKSEDMTPLTFRMRYCR